MGQVYFSRNKLSDKGRRKAKFAACLNFGFYLVVAGMLITPLFPGLRPRADDLRRLPHPAEMAGTWVFNGVDGDPVLELVLSNNGNLRYRQLLEPKVDFKGSWGLGDWVFYFRCERLLVGQWTPDEKIVGYDFEGFTEREINLRDREGIIRFVRKE